MLTRYFAIDMPFWRFARNTLVVSLAGMVPLLLIYVGLTPRFGPLLIHDGLAMRLFLRQVLTDGLTVVFVVNYLCFFTYAALAAREGSAAAPRAILLIDPPLRVAVFIALHGLIYFLSADWFGSFGGDHWLALRVVGPTLSQSPFFANLEGVYFYATLGSALPVYAQAIRPWLLGTDRPQRWPALTPGAILRDRPSVLALIMALLVFALASVMLGTLALAITLVQPG